MNVSPPLSTKRSIRLFRRGEAQVLRFVVACFCLAFLSGCRKAEVEGEAPPKPAPSSVGRCASVADAPLDGLPGKVGGFCLDPLSDVRRYGEGTSSPLDDVCVELFNGECEIYKSYGLEGVKTTSYVADKKPGTVVQVVVSRFRRSGGAYGFYTRRLLGDGLPSQLTVKALLVEGRAALGLGVAYVWRGKQVVELSYVSESETPEEVARNSEPVLKTLASSTAALLIGPKVPGRSVRLLETIGASPFDVAVRSDSLFGLDGSGEFAVAYFEKPDKDSPHRLIAAHRRDESAAKDLLKLAVRHFPSKKIKGTGVYRLRWSAEGQSPETWYLSTFDNLFLAVGPLAQLNSPSTSTPESRKEESREWAAFARTRLRQLLATARENETSANEGASHRPYSRLQ